MAPLAGDRVVPRPHPVLDVNSYGARSRDGTAVAPLTVLQYTLLCYLAYLPAGKVATWGELARELGPFDAAPMTERTIQSDVTRLRKRLSQGRWYEPPGGDALAADLDCHRSRLGAKVGLEHSRQAEG